MEIVDELVKVSAGPLGTLLLVLGNAGAAMAIRWINGKTKSQNIRTAVGTLTTVVQAEVARLNQQMVKSLKDDGKFSADEKARINAVARDSINAQLPAGVRRAAGHAVRDLPGFIDSLIEQAVAAAKGPPAIR